MEHLSIYDTTEGGGAEAPPDHTLVDGTMKLFYDRTGTAVAYIWGLKGDAGNSRGADHNRFFEVYRYTYRSSNSWSRAVVGRSVYVVSVEFETSETNKWIWKKKKNVLRDEGAMGGGDGPLIGIDKQRWMHKYHRRRITATHRRFAPAMHVVRNERH